MENASKALLIAGAILLAILIIAIGMFIFTSAQSQVNDALTDMSSQQIEAFNSNFSSYDASQVGSQVKSLLGRLIANGNTYTEEPAKVPTVVFTDKTGDPDKGGDGKVSDTCTDKSFGKIAYTNSDASQMNNYINALGKARNFISTKHKYYVEFGYTETGLISSVVIYYVPPTSSSEK